MITGSQHRCGRRVPFAPAPTVITIPTGVSGTSTPPTTISTASMSLA